MKDLNKKERVSKKESKPVPTPDESVNYLRGFGYEVTIEDVKESFCSRIQLFNAKKKNKPYGN